jgi:hypothetical protein
MDGDRFDSLTRAMTAAGTHRRALVLALGGALAPLLGIGETDARNKLKKCKKIDDKKRRKKCIKKAKNADSCQDGKKNGSESDVDCGGTCPRCQGGQICNSRDDCHTARCVANTCQSCVNPATDCGFEKDGVTGCFCRDNAQKPGEKMCTRQLCNFIAGGTCDLCAAGEQCAPAGGGIECCIPCGA